EHEGSARHLGAAGGAGDVRSVISVCGVSRYWLPSVVMRVTTARTPHACVAWLVARRRAGVGERAAVAIWLELPGIRGRVEGQRQNAIGRAIAYDAIGRRSIEAAVTESACPYNDLHYPAGAV